eukprot:CAMPEP_0206378348 /NCGR_PEP_ID=MMETSP0294-20121207/10684_1 /ASSEMBLY_ACC=CAM_ASM_000327 /TAXON_ID=39354 /ORGANISM="Heterosigma akashiwo, Strain CCMP2393" /LENGTH=187 /DNA_ID=CAMNT_0053826967 /DNA_START=13 /DNA_END=573 /DNA_ORIENTATION=+
MSGNSPDKDEAKTASSENEDNLTDLADKLKLIKRNWEQAYREFSEYRHLSTEFEEIQKQFHLDTQPSVDDQGGVFWEDYSDITAWLPASTTPPRKSLSAGPTNGRLQRRARRKNPCAESPDAAQAQTQGPAAAQDQDDGASDQAPPPPSRRKSGGGGARGGEDPAAAAAAPLLLLRHALEEGRALAG